jgi:hypothetical protein
MEESNLICTVNMKGLQWQCTLMYPTFLFNQPMHQGAYFHFRALHAGDLQREITKFVAVLA